MLEEMGWLHAAYAEVLAFLGDGTAQRQTRAAGGLIGLFVLWWCMRRLPGMTQGEKKLLIVALGAAAAFVSWSPFFERDAFTRTALAFAWLCVLWAVFCLLFFRARPRRRDYSHYRPGRYRRRRSDDSMPFPDSRPWNHTSPGDGGSLGDAVGDLVTGDASDT
ncbi:MAG TPA: hypothetical protein VEB23_02410 [Ramlibacter sp.]|nr:hypothetical protein [Ramlibacter sp.]